MGPVPQLLFGLASLMQQSKAAKKAEQQQEFQRRTSVRKVLRERQLKRAQARITAEGAGIGFSSAAAGGIASLGAQTGTAIGRAGVMSGLSKDITRLQSSANMLSGLGSLAGEMPAGDFSLPTMQIGGPNSLFGGNSWG